MASGAIRRLHVGIEAVSILIVEFVDAAGRVVPVVAVDTIVFLLVTRLTPLRLTVGFLCMLVAPAQRVNREKISVGVVAE